MKRITKNIKLIVMTALVVGFAYQETNARGIFGSCGRLKANSDGSYCCQYNWFYCECKRDPSWNCGWF